MISFRLAAAAAAIALSPALADAQDYSAQMKARQGQFRIMALNLGILGAMAKGEAPYDAEVAKTAAANIDTITTLDQTAMWPEGSDDMSIDGTRAQVTIWEDSADFAAKWDALGTATAALADVAGSGQEALGPAVGATGGACGACHKAHRAPEN